MFAWLPAFFYEAWTKRRKKDKKKNTKHITWLPFQPENLFIALSQFRFISLCSWCFVHSARVGVVFFSSERMESMSFIWILIIFRAEQFGYRLARLDRQLIIINWRNEKTWARVELPAHMGENTVIISKDRQWFFMAHICFQENIRNLKHVFVGFVEAKLIFSVWNVILLSLIRWVLSGRFNRHFIMSLWLIRPSMQHNFLAW